MNVDVPTAPPSPNYGAARRAITEALGRERIVELHQGSKVRDLWAFLWPPLAVAGCAATIGWADSWLVRVPLIIFQGFLIVSCANTAHSMFTHRRPFGKRIGRWQGLMLATVATLSGSIYTESHHHHHRTLNTAEDQDFENVDLDRSWKRLFYASSILGYLLAGDRRLSDRRYRPFIWNARSYFRRKLMADPKTRRELYGEFAYVAAYWAAVAVVAWFHTSAVLFGYLVPLFFVAPAVNSLREAAEHFDVQLDNPYSIATAWEPGWFTATFNHQTGTTHWVHHMWPNIPHYRCREAWREMRPLVEAAGVEVKSSYLALLADYYLRGKTRLWYRNEAGERVDVATLAGYGDPDFAASRR